jgi:HK97 family phage portal protein
VGRRSIADLITGRAATTKQTPVPFASRAASHGVLTARRDAESQMRAMSATGTLFAIIDRMANAVSLVDWKLYRKAKSGKKEDRQEVTTHAALDVWNRPNKFMPRQEFTETFQQHYDLTGEAWWVIGHAKTARLPLEMWPVRPDRMMPVADRDKFLTGYVYTGPDGERIPLELDEVIQLRRPNPLDPYRGLSPVLSILPDLDTSRYAAEWSRAFFLNDAAPGGIIEVPTVLSDQEFDELRDRWNEQHRGVGNAHKVAILEHGTWKDRTVTQRDMQFVELRGATRDAIREAYGIPKFAVGDLDDVNRAVAEAAKAWFAEQLTVPRLERIKGALNNELLPMFGATARGLEFDYTDPVPPDTTVEAEQLTARANAAGVLVDAGFEPAGTLSAVGLPDIAYVGRPATAPAQMAPVPSDWEDAVAGLLDGTGVEAAQRWVAECADDANSCQPCIDNDGRTYRNRAEAYKDYPGGSGYVRCKGGANCRCKVVKRGRKGEGE